MEITFITTLINAGKAMIVALDNIYLFDGFRVSVWDMAILGTIIEMIFEYILFTADEYGPDESGHLD